MHRNHGLFEISAMHYFFDGLSIAQKFKDARLKLQSIDICLTGTVIFHKEHICIAFMLIRIIKALFSWNTPASS